MFYWHITVLTCRRYFFLRLHLALWLTFWFYKKRHVKACREHAKKTFHHPVWSRLASRLLFPSRSPIIFLKLWWVVSFFKVEIMKLSTAHQPVIGDDYFSAFQMLRELPGVLLTLNLFQSWDLIDDLPNHRVIRVLDHVIIKQVIASLKGSLTLIFLIESFKLKDHWIKIIGPLSALSF